MKRRIQETINNSFIPCFLIVDCAVAVGVILFWYFLYYDDVFKINDFYIHCSDISYKYPDEKASVSETTLYVVSFIVPSIVIVLFELVMAEYNRRVEAPPKEKSLVTFDFKVNTTMRRVIRYIGLFLIGAFSTLIFAGIGRVIVGRPAPHFFTACPGLLEGCSGGYVQFNSNTCPNDIPGHTRSSFPSYFAALSTYSALFGGLYLSKMMTITTARTLRPLFFIIIILLPFMVSLDRVASHQEHWTDVIAGFLIGFFIALYMCLVVLSGFEGSQEKVQENAQNPQSDLKQSQKGDFRGSGIMQTLTREASRASSRHASRREKGENFLSSMHEVRYNTPNRRYYENNSFNNSFMDHDRRRQEDFIRNHQTPIPSFGDTRENPLSQDNHDALEAFKKEAHDADLGNGDVGLHLAADDQPMFLYHH